MARTYPASTQDQALQAVRQSIAAENNAKARRRRALLQATEVGVTQRTLAARLGVSQAAIAHQVSSARANTRSVPDGFTGASAREIIDQYVAGELTRDQVIDQLARWDYAPAQGNTDDYFDGGFGVTPSEFSVVEEACRVGDLDDDIYRALFARLIAKGA